MREQLSNKLGDIIVLATVVLVPLVMWLGFADNVEVPKALVYQALVAFLLFLTLIDPGRRQRLIRSPLLLPLIGLALVAWVSGAGSGAAVVSWSGQPGSWRGAAQIGSLFLGALVVSAWLTRARTHKMFAGVLGSAGFLLIYALLQKVRLDPFPWNPELKSGYWIFATLGNPVHLGNFLVCAFWLSFAVPGCRGWPAWIFRVALAVGMLATQQRSALLALACGGVIALWQSRNRGPTAPGHQPFRRLKSGWGAGLCAAALMSVLVLSTGGRGWSLDRLAGARMEIWKVAGRLLSSRPWLGIGPDLFHARFLSRATYQYFVAEPPAVKGAVVSPRLPASAHNELMEVATGQGLLGLGMYVWVLLIAVRACRSAPFLPAAVSCWFVHLTNPASVATSALFWVLIAALVVSRSPSPCPGRQEPTRGRPPPRSGGEGRVVVCGPSPRGRGIGAWFSYIFVAAFLTCALATSLRTATAQAHRREAGRLSHFGRSAELARHLDRWGAYTARLHPHQAHENAWLLRRRWESDPAGLAAVGQRAADLWAAAHRANPYDVFYLTALADFELARGKHSKDPAASRRAEALLREALQSAPAALSLYDDLAGALAAQGKLAEAGRLRELRKRLDVKGLFAAGEPPEGAGRFPEP